MKLKEISEGIFYIGFKKREKIANTFMKLHGYYENPKFKGKIFSEKQFERWFRLHTSMGKEYELRFRDIAGGFNIPDYNFKPFIQGKFDLIKEEKELIEKISEIDKNKFIIISSIIGEEEFFKHELAHAYFYMKKNYKEEIIGYFKSIPKTKLRNMEKVLECHEVYHPSRFIDEMQANLLTKHNTFLFNKRLDENFLREANKNIQQIFNKYNLY